MKRLCTTTAMLLVLATLSHGAASAQQPATPAQSQQPALAPLTPAQEQARILADSQRLFQLAAELKLELVNTPPGALSLGVVKKAAEIEKLALSLNQRVKD